MAPSKRKRTSTHSKSNKRQKVPDSSPSSDYWKANCILEERIADDGNVQYLIEWVGIDPATRRPYEPTWEPAENATELLIAEWERSKVEAGKAKKAASKSSGRTARGTKGQTAQLPLDPPPRSARTSRVLESSPEQPSTRAFISTSAQSTPARSTALSQSPAYSTPPKLPQPSPQVLVHKRPTFDRDNYDRWSQLPISSSSIGSTRRNLLSSSQCSYTGPRNYLSSGVVYDSEGGDDVEEDGSVTYVPSSQDSSLSASTQTQSSPNEIYSLSVSTPFKNIGPASLAISIPETEPEPEHDSIEDSQAHNSVELHPQEDQGGALDTLDTIISTSQPAPRESYEKSQQSFNKEQRVDITGKIAQPIEQITETNTGEQTTCLNPNTELAISAAQLEDDIITRELLWLARGREEPVQLFQEEQQVEEPPAQAPLSRIAEFVEHAEPSSDHLIPLVSQQNLDGEGEQQPARQNNLVGPPSDLHTSVSIAAGFQPQEQQLSTTEQDYARLGNIESSKCTSLNAATRAGQVLQTVIHGTTECQDFASNSHSVGFQNPSSSHSLTASAPVQQHAQIVPGDDLYFSTQDEFSESIRPTVETTETIEKDAPLEHQESPQSRHDSSQESPEPSTSAPVFSPLPPPPNQSLGTLGPNAPGRPRTPLDSLTLSPIMSQQESIEAEIKELFATANRENPFVPTRKLKQQTRLPTAGTRSPSTIPDHSPMPQAPTSLRTVALANSIPVSPEAGPSESAPPVQDEAESGVSDSNHAPPNADPVDPASTDDEELSDANDDASLLNDDLQLQSQEYIVPLPIEGRQASMYREEINNNQDILKSFIEDPEGFDQIDKIEKVLQKFKAIETHIDLIYSENEASQGFGSTQFQHQVQWSNDNSIKFKFIGTLLHKLRDQDLHVILVMEKHDVRLFALIETFLRGKFINFKSPTRGNQADLAHTEGNLMVTVLSCDSSPIVQPPDLIISIDGSVSAEQIRKKNWVTNPDQSVVPVLHLVIPRTIDHLQRYVSSSLNSRRRLHTIIATLAQLQSQGDIGRAMYSHSLNMNATTDEIVAFLTLHEDAPSQNSWPLPSIGSIKDIIEFQSQQSQEIISSPPSNLTVAKRPLEDVTLDPAKRMRFTPQPDMQPNSSENYEITHISDSMPGTAIQISRLQEQLIAANKAAKSERDLRKANEKYFSEKEISWAKQQKVHEDLSSSYHVIKKGKENLETQLEAAAKREGNIRERLDARTTEYRDLETRYKTLQDAQLSSDDQKIVEIARLTKELAAAKESEQRAIHSQKSTEATLEYTTEQYRNVQTVATTLRQENEELKADLIVQTKKGSGEIRRLAQLHYEQQSQLAIQQADRIGVHSRTLEKQLQHKEEENIRLRNGRGVGVGTRAQSVGPKSSKPASRAASPMPGNRDRLANLRNG